MIKTLHLLASASLLTLVLLLDVVPAVAAAAPLRMVLQWEHQAQFAGYYMALEKDFYAEEQLDVRLVAGGPDVDPLQMVRSGQAEFCSAMLASALSSTRPESDDLVLVQQLVNRSNQALVAWKHGRQGDALIESPGDLDHKPVTLWEGFRAPARILFERYQITPEIIPQYSSFSLFLRRGADACSAMFYNEVHSIKQLNIGDDQLSIFDFQALGIDLPEDGIYARRQFCRDRSGVCAAFGRASIKGWQYARQHEQETLDVVMRYVESDNLATNRAHMAWMLRVMLESIFPASDSGWRLGQLSSKGYSRALSILGLAASAPAYSDFVARGAQLGVD